MSIGEHMSNIKSESKFTFFEATGIIVGHGVGAGILSVPFLASLNRWYDFLWILFLAYTINLVMHFMIAELSYNNNGLQFIKCLEREIFIGKYKTIISYSAFILLLLSVIFSISGYIAGASAVFTAWFSMPSWAGTLLFYILATSVVYTGMKMVGICEKIAVSAMFIIIFVIFMATLFNEWHMLPDTFKANSNLLAMYGMIAFSLSAVMSVPQVVKGLDGDVKKIRSSIALGTFINVLLITMITLMTILAAGKNVSENGALVDLALSLGGWVAILGYIFSLLALATSFWANTLNLRDIVAEQTKFNLKLSWFIASFPCLIIALIGVQTFIGFIRIASIIQIVTGIAIIVAYNRSRKKSSQSLICGFIGKLPFQIIVVAGSIVATLGSVATIVK